MASCPGADEPSRPRTGPAASAWPALSWSFHVRRVCSPRQVRVPGPARTAGACTLGVV